MMSPLWWVIALMVALALAFFLWPMRRKATGSHLEQVRRRYLETNVVLFREHLAELEASRDAGRLSQSAFEQLKREQERALLQEERELATSKPTRGRALPGGRVLVVSALVLLAGSIGWYEWRGASEDLHLAELQMSKSQLDREDRMNDRRVDPGRTWNLVEQIQKRLDDNPDSTQHLFLLAMYSRELGHYDRAIEAYERILELEPESPRIQAELAETLFIRDDNRIGSRARELIEQALENDPQETTALGLAGIDAFGKQNFQDAIRYWQRALDQMDPRSGNAQAFQRGVERARNALAQRGETPEAQSDEPDTEATIEIPLRVRLGEEVDFDGDQWVFVFARAWEGSPMPLAITRFQANQLPSSIVLDNTMGMSPAASLSSVEEVELVARLSKDGDATPKPGDWQGRFGPVALDDVPEGLELVIDEPVTE